MALLDLLLLSRHEYQAVLTAMTLAGYDKLHHEFLGRRLRGGRAQLRMAPRLWPPRDAASWDL
jgi:hypothetical protein